MNSAELSWTFIFLGCPLAAGLVAASEKAGWYTLLFVVGGLAFGLILGYLVHNLSYRLFEIKVPQSKPILDWSMLIAYFLIMQIAVFGAIAMTGWLAWWIARHV